jgi:hypothetical protein
MNANRIVPLRRREIRSEREFANDFLHTYPGVRVMPKPERAGASPLRWFFLALGLVAAVLLAAHFLARVA